MYNLETLQINHPRLKKLNNWTGNVNPNKKEFETPKFSHDNQVTLVIQNKATRLEERIGSDDDGASLTNRTLPPISQKGLTKVPLREEEQLEDNEKTFLKRCPEVLPPIKVS